MLFFELIFLFVDLTIESKTVLKSAAPSAGDTNPQAGIFGHFPIAHGSFNFVCSFFG